MNNLKNKIAITLLSLTMIFVSIQALAWEKSNQSEYATQQLQKWVDAVKSRNPQIIASLYEEDAVLLATFAEKPLLNNSERLNYFRDLVKKDFLSVKLNNVYMHENGNIAIANGTYTFSYIENDKDVEVPARFSFVFEYEIDKGWKIESHHSSLVPKK